MLPVAAGRGGPFNLHWEIHGRGPVKLTFISGLGVLKTSWQRQTLHFGHLNRDKYSVLLVDNRGMGRSDKPVMRYSTSEMAKDLLEVLEHVAWTGEREIHVCGISMGGMIAQELACAIPQRMASLSLICTAAAIENTTSFSENMINRITMLLPKSLDRTILYTAENLFPETWLLSPDDAPVPDANTPKFHLPPGHKPAKIRFRTNYERFAAQEITKKTDPKAGFTRRGFLMQIIAAGWHHKTPKQLTKMADEVGRERILILHGEEDRVISVPHGRKLVQYIRPGKGIIVEGMGHAPIAERTQYFNDLIVEMCAKGEELSGR
ncbi:Alpha/Beta hydrolase protein [Poronia punctata]|nr:Alpha/Beta hydrolase protein [Poronia punctata]